MSAALDTGKARSQNHSPGSAQIAWLAVIMNRVLRVIQPKSKGRHALRRLGFSRHYAACTVQGAFRTMDMMGRTRIAPKRVLFTTDPTVRDSLEIFGDWRRVGFDIEKAISEQKPQKNRGQQLSLFE